MRHASSIKHQKLIIDECPYVMNMMQKQRDASFRMGSPEFSARNRMQCGPWTVQVAHKLHNITRTVTNKGSVICHVYSAQYISNLPHSRKQLHAAALQLARNELMVHYFYND